MNEVQNRVSSLMGSKFGYFNATRKALEAKYGPAKKDTTTETYNYWYKVNEKEEFYDGDKKVAKALTQKEYNTYPSLWWEDNAEKNAKLEDMFRNISNYETGLTYLYDEKGKAYRIYFKCKEGEVSITDANNNNVIDNEDSVDFEVKGSIRRNTVKGFLEKDFSTLGGKQKIQNARKPRETHKPEAPEKKEYKSTPLDRLIGWFIEKFF